MTTLSNGIQIEESRWNSPNMTPASECAAVFGFPRTTNRITIHWWGLPEWNQQFDAVCNFLSDGNRANRTSAHFVVEDGRVACLVSPENVAWHAGNAEGNATSIGIECNPRMTSGDIDTLVALIVSIEEWYGEQVIWLHREWSSTECPGTYADMRDEIVRRVNAHELTSGNADKPSGLTVADAIHREIQRIRESADTIENSL